MGSNKPANPEVPEAAKPILGQMQSMVPSFTGMTLDPRIYSMTGLQSLSQNAGQNMFGSAIPNATNTLSSILSPGFTSPTSNPYLGQVMSGLGDQFTRGLGSGLDMLGSQFGLMGMNPRDGSAPMNAASNFARNALGDYTNNVGNILMGQYNTGVNQQLQGLQSLGMIPNVLNSLSGLGSLPQQLASTQQYGQIGLNQMPFDMLSQILSGMPLTYPSHNPTNPWTGALGGAASGAAAGSSMGPWGALGMGVAGGTAGYFQNR